MDSFTSYAKPAHTAHPSVRNMLEGSDNLIYQEKVDGSQISFGVDALGTIFVRSRSRTFDVHAPDNMFKAAAESIISRAHLLHPGWTYRGEYLRKEKHNILSYGRVPKGNIVLFDISYGLHDYIDCPEAMASEAERVELEYAQVFHRGPVSLKVLDDLLERESMLGDVKIEGIVLKDHAGMWFGRDSKPVMAKFVSDRFKEQHQAHFKSYGLPQKDDVTTAVAKAVSTEARWHKAVQHLREAGELKGEPCDIGPLIQELATDIGTECMDDMKEMLWQRFKKDIMRRCTRPFPDWYRRQLAEGAIGE